MLKKERLIYFPEGYHITKDKKTIVGECIFNNILFLDYRDSEAGSNPREYQGLTKTNKEILESLLVNYKSLFKFLHSGVIISITGMKKDNDKNITYRSNCLTNGNQTRFLILILMLIKEIFHKNKLKRLSKSELQSYLEERYSNQPEVKQLLELIKLEHFNQVINFLSDNPNRLTSYDKINSTDFLASRIRVIINVIDNIIENLENLDENSTGTQIATANNETQRVKVDDIFGTMYKKLLRDEIFKDFILEKVDYDIEYSYGETTGKDKSVHILKLLRPIVYTGILTLDSDVYKYSNQRIPIYNIFKKLLREKDKARKTVEGISKLIPFLYDINEEYIIDNMKAKRNKKKLELESHALEGKLNNTSIRDKIKVDNGDLTDETKSVINKISNYNLAHIFPVVTYAIRKYLELDEKTERIKLTVKEKDKFFNAIIDACYNEYVDIKLRRVTTSLSDAVREQSFFESGEKVIPYIQNFITIKESDFISKVRFILKQDKKNK